MSPDFEWWFKRGCFFGASLIVILAGICLAAWGGRQEDPFRVVVGLIFGAAVIIGGVGLFFAFAAPIASRILYASHGESRQQ